MKITEVIAQPDFFLRLTTTDGRVGKVDVRPYLGLEAFESLNDPAEFLKVRNGGYFVEWECGADLSADSLEARLVEINPRK
jgi:hypothetical protein